MLIFLFMMNVSIKYPKLELIRSMARGHLKFVIL